MAQLHSGDPLFAGDPETLARQLIGAAFTVDGVGGVIVETEAYRADDPASHSFNGPTARSAVMFGPPGRAYVYRSYGLHWCVNIVCGDQPGGAVLLRALEPAWGIERMVARRGTDVARHLCAGPGRLCQALAIDHSHNGLPVDEAPFGIGFPVRPTAAQPPAIVRGPRIGISRAADLPWRFGLKGSRFLSRPFPSHDGEHPRRSEP